MKLAFQVWSHPRTGTYAQRIAKLPVTDYSVQSLSNNAGKLSLQLRSTYDRLDEILKTDPVNPDEGVGSIIRVVTDQQTDPIQHYLVTSLEEDLEEQGFVTITGEEMPAELRRYILLPWDFPKNPMVNPDWIYDGENILQNPGFELDSPQGWTWLWWLDDTVDGGTYVLHLLGDDATIDWDATASEIKTALETAWTSVISVSVTGSGTEDNPFVLTITDPADITATPFVDDSDLQNGFISALVDTDVDAEKELRYWQRSRNLARGGTEHGSYASDGFRLSRDGEPVRSGNFSLRVNGLSLYAGLMQVVRVKPGMRYQASIWVYTSSAEDMFRLIIRDRFEKFIASSHGLSGTTVPPNTWTEFKIDFVAPEGADLVVFRFAFIGKGAAGIEGNPEPFYVDDASLKEGMPPATVGEIWNDVLDDCALDHADPPHNRKVLDWVTRTWTDTHTSGGQPWDEKRAARLVHGKNLEQLWSDFAGLGYQMTWTWNSSTEQWEMNLYNPGELGNRPGTALTYRGGLAGASPYTRRAPDYSYAFVESPDGYWADGSQSDLESAFGRTETWKRIPIATDATSLVAATDELLLQALAKTFGIRLEFGQNPVHIPGIDFKVHDIVPVQLGPKVSADLIVQEITLSPSDTGDAIYSVQVGSRVVTPGAAMAESVEFLLKQFRELPKEAREVFTAGLGPHGGMAHLLLVSTSESADVRMKADYEAPQGAASSRIRDLANTAWGGTWWMAGVFHLDTDVQIGETDIRGLNTEEILQCL